jgi:signal transduction histidine kinase
LDKAENINLSAAHDHLLETYSPVWLSGTDQVIAVAEFYQLTDDLDSEIATAKRRSWLVVSFSILLTYLLLSGFVRQASDTISRQQAELGQKVVQLTGLLSQNRELHARVRRAAASVALLNESTLRRIGAELHDGPAQDLGLALLKLDALAGRIEDHLEQIPGPALIGELSSMEGMLQNALKEMRGISAGLSLPQLSDLTLSETVVRAVRAHEVKTGTRVDLELDSLPDQAALPLRTTLYRLVQEALSNAFRHAGGAGQQVRVCGEGPYLLVEISDQGPGFDPQEAGSKSGRLGLSWMRERVESLGGLFELRSQVGIGTRIIARLPSQLEGGDEG